jgi:predicted MPP superfamily phosphohydrolase
LAQVQTTLLVNEMQVVHIRGRALRMVGLDDGTASQPDADLLAQSDGNTVVLQHSPGWFLSPEAQRSRWKAALCLSGHTHGGQIAPLGQAIWTPRGSGPFVAGFYQLDACPLYVSRGVGTSVIPVRLGASAELAVFEW